MSLLESSLRQMRIIHVALLLSIPLYVFAGEYLGPSEPRDVKLAQLALGAMAAADLGIAYFFRQRLRAAEEALRMRAEDAAALARWRVASMVSLVICESTAVLGFALRLLGATLWQATPFYAVALVLMLVWVPRLELS
jgi:predicted Abi (CAAX) family protease